MTKKKTTRRFSFLLLLVILVVLPLTLWTVNQKTNILGSAQTNKSSPQRSSTPGEYFTVKVGRESFVFYTTNQQTIQDARRAYDQKLPLFPDGKLRKGRENYNPSWSWYYDYQDVEMVEVSMEVCDGSPSDVERNLNYWLNTVGRFCPWSGRIARVGLSPTPTPTPVASYQGVIKKLEVSIYQQGTHLLDIRSPVGKEKVILLQSKTYNLDKYLGRKVEVRGRISPLIEGGGILIDVTSIKLLH